MPTLPDAANAVVEEKKVRDYLLNLEHKQGGGKARLFLAFGFLRSDWAGLVQALRAHAQAYEADAVATRFGLRYKVEGPLDTPSGRRPWIRAVWEIKDGPPRLVTAYVKEAPSDD